MVFLQLFNSLLKVLRVLFVVGTIIITIAAIFELFGHSFKDFSWKDLSYINVVDPYFSKNIWVVIITIAIIACIFYIVKACSAIIRTMDNFKKSIYFETANGKDLKLAGRYYLIAMIGVPMVIEIIHFLESLLAPQGQLQPFSSDVFMDIIETLLTGSFLYVMGEVIQKAVNVKEENDLTI